MRGVALRQTLPHRLLQYHPAPDAHAPVVKHRKLTRREPLVVVLDDHRSRRTPVAVETQRTTVPILPVPHLAVQLRRLRRLDIRRRRAPRAPNPRVLDVVRAASGPVAIVRQPRSLAAEPERPPVAVPRRRYIPGPVELTHPERVPLLVHAVVVLGDVHDVPVGVLGGYVPRPAAEP